MENLEIHLLKNGSEIPETIIYPNEDGKFTIDEDISLDVEFKIINKGE